MVFLLSQSSGNILTWPIFASFPAAGRESTFRLVLTLALAFAFQSIRLALDVGGSLSNPQSDDAWIPQHSENSSRFDSGQAVVSPVNVVGSAKSHNQTVDGAPLPGSFQNGLFFVLGARWTTLYDDPNFLSLTLFTMPGDFFRRKKEGKVRCQSDLLKPILLEFQHVFPNVLMYAQLDCQGVPCGDPIQMQAIDTSQSPDSHQNKVTQIWTANVTHLLTHPQLRSFSSKYPSQNQSFSAIRVHFWVKHGWPLVSGNNSTSSDDGESNTFNASADTKWKPIEIVPSSNPTLYKLTAVDIPLTTRVVGHAGPSTTFPTSTHQPKPTLCVATYGAKARHYYSTFIQHHLNVGFGSVVIGLMDATMGSPQWRATRDLLQPYIQRGLVHVAAADLTAIQCEVNIRKVHFYNACLYHSKGVSPYMGIWDLDEMWMPPMEGNDDLFQKYVPESKWNNSEMFEKDHLWRKSAYAQLPSVIDSLNAASAYQRSFGCEHWFCFQGFPSNVIFRRRVNGTSDKLVEQIHDLSHDFERMDDYTDWEWSKSITKTRKAEMGGIHLPGACRAEVGGEAYVPRDKLDWTNKMYNPSKTHQTCRNLRMKGFGSMHHYYAMLSYRSYDKQGGRADLGASTYHKYFANTVKAQLQRLGFET